VVLVKNHEKSRKSLIFIGFHDFSLKIVRVTGEKS